MPKSKSISPKLGQCSPAGTSLCLRCREVNSRFNSPHCYILGQAESGVLCEVFVVALSRNWDRVHHIETSSSIICDHGSSMYDFVRRSSHITMLSDTSGSELVILGSVVRPATFVSPVIDACSQILCRLILCNVHLIDISS